MKPTIRMAVLALCLAALTSAAVVRGHEGMWLFTDLPREQLKKYDFEPTKEWLENIQKSSIRFPHGSGSFISSDGLVITNHHVGAEALQQLGSEKNNYLRDGFHA